MNEVFADTLYWIALVRPGDAWSDSARRAGSSLAPGTRLVTSDEVLGEFLAAVSSGGSLLRRKAVETVRMLLAAADVRVLKQSRDSFVHAVNRYSQREDKSYSLVDCSSMNAMDDAGIREVLTNDRHFEQDGYRILIVKD